MFQVRFRATENGTPTVLTLTPRPTDVEYPEERSLTVRPSVDGAITIQRPLRDSRPRKWSWKGYHNNVVPYVALWTQLEALDYRTRALNNLWPFVEIFEDETGIGGFDRRDGSNNPIFTRVRFVRVERTLRSGGGRVVYEDSFVEFYIDDATYTAF